MTECRAGRRLSSRSAEPATEERTARRSQPTPRLDPLSHVIALERLRQPGGQKRAWRMTTAPGVPRCFAACGSSKATRSQPMPLPSFTSRGLAGPARYRCASGGSVDDSIAFPPILSPDNFPCDWDSYRPSDGGAGSVLRSFSDVEADRARESAPHQVRQLSFFDLRSRHAACLSLLHGGQDPARALDRPQRRSSMLISRLGVPRLRCQLLGRGADRRGAGVGEETIGASRPLAPCTVMTRTSSRACRCRA